MVKRIRLEYVVETEKYRFAMFSVNEDSNWYLTYRGTTADNEEEEEEEDDSPTYSEVFQIVTDIFKKMNEETVASIFFAFEEKDYTFYRKTTKLDFYEFMFGNEEI